MNYSNSLTAVIEHDWCARNLFALQSSLREAEAAAASRSDPTSDPLMKSPNLPIIRGQLRWALLPPILENHLRAGRYAGIAGKWISLGSVSVFELEGECTSITACHLSHEDDVPRESTYRKDRRRLNSGPQMPLPFEEGNASNIDPDLKVNLTLVYGGLEEPFAYLRAYFDEDKRSYYHKVSSNIMALPTLLDSTETEQIPDPQIGLGLKLNPARFYKAS